MTKFSAIEAWSFRAWLAWAFFLWLGDRCIGIHIVTGVLSAIVGGSNMGQVHWDLYVVVGWVWCIGRVVCGPLLLLLQLWLSSLSLLTVPPCSWLELILILAKGVVEWSGVRESSSSSDELYDLPSFHDLDSLCFVFGIGGQEGCSYDFI